MLSSDKKKQYKNELVNLKNFEKKADLLKTIGDPTSLKIVKLLIEEKELCPSDLAEILSLSLPAVSYQLHKLKNLDLVSTVRLGQMICYSLNDNKKVSTIKSIVNSHEI